MRWAANWSWAEPGANPNLGTAVTVAHDTLMFGCRPGRNVSPSYGCTGGLFAEEAIGLLQRFYMAGNPRGVLHRHPSIHHAHTHARTMHLQQYWSG